LDGNAHYQKEACVVKDKEKSKILPVFVKKHYLWRMNFSLRDIGISLFS
jgi:hypothetical protein